MSLIEDIPELVKETKSFDAYLEHNFNLYEIFQGNLLKYIKEDLSKQLSEQSYNQAQFRIPPINVLRRIIEKQSKVYANPPNRVVTGSDQERELFEFYAESFKINQKMGIANSFFNLFKNTLIEPFVHTPYNDAPNPKLRIIPSDRFVVISTDKQDRSVPTLVIICEGKYKPTETGSLRRYYRAVSAERFIIFDEDKRDLTAKFAPENPLGVNPYGRLPFVYINRSTDDAMPIQDTDTMRMSILIPTLLADTNYASMFQAFSILYGIDVDDRGLKMAPNAFWTFKTEPGTDAKPSIGQLNPQMDVSGSLNLIASQLAFWLNSRGIRPGAIGDINSQNFSSGISKMIDEMDISEDRKMQIPYFQDAEDELWDLVLHYMHPVWSASGLVENNTTFSPTSFVTTIFPEQLPLTRRADIVKESIDEINAGLTTGRRAIRRLNPEMTEEEIDVLMEEIGNLNELVVPDGMAENSN